MFEIDGRLLFIKLFVDAGVSIRKQRNKAGETTGEFARKLEENFQTELARLRKVQDELSHRISH